jgi:hypothetical protein
MTFVTGGLSLMLWLVFAAMVVSVASGQESTYDILMDFYHSTNGAAWTANTNWGSTDVPYCQWYGIMCIPQAGGAIVTLGLFYNNLVGTLPPSLGNLTSLQNLLLPFNKLTGSIPASYGSLSNLETIMLQNNLLSGEIPTALSSMGQLQQLKLEGNLLSGAVPSWLGALPNLTYVGVSNNQLTGSLPASFGSLLGLTNLYAEQNLLTGIDVALADWGYPFFCNLSNNTFKCPIPSWAESICEATCS